MIPGLEKHRESMGSDLCVHFVAGGLAGITAASATYPLDLVRTRLAAQVISLGWKVKLCFLFQLLRFVFVRLFKELRSMVFSIYTVHCYCCDSC